MARIYPLFSSSKGNSSFIGNSDGGILVDAGVSCKRLCEALKANEIDPAVIQGIFITHTHIPTMFRGLKFSRRNIISLYLPKRPILRYLYLTAK